MRVRETRDLFADEFAFPVDVETVRSELGDVELDAPGSEESRTLGEILDGVEDQSFASADELHQAVLANLGDEFVGRKYYDDRGPNVNELEDGGGGDPREGEDTA